MIDVVYGEETCNVAKFGGAGMHGQFALVFGREIILHILIKFVQGRRSRGLDLCTVASRAGHGIARGVDVV